MFDFCRYFIAPSLASVEPLHVILFLSPRSVLVESPQFVNLSGTNAEQT